MPTHIAAMGKAGVKIAEALIYAAVAGVADGEMRVVLIGAEREEAERLRMLTADYESVSARVQASGASAFSAHMTLDAWPEERQTRSLNDQAENEKEKLLCAALFTREEASLSPAHALDSSRAVAAMTWAGLLGAGDCAALEPMKSAEDRVVVVGSLCEAVCAAGVTALPDWLGRRCDAVLTLAEVRADDAAMCRAALEDGEIRSRMDAMTVIGLPEDCRGESADQPRLCEWLAALSIGRLKRNGEGVYAWQVPCDASEWRTEAAAFDFLTAYDALLRASCLMGATYGPPLKVALQSPNWLRDRLTVWYNTYFSAVKSMSERERGQLLTDVEKLMTLLRRFVVWMEAVQKSFPAVMRWYKTLEKAQSTAREHYAHVLDTAGQVAWLQFEAERSGMAQERFVHRHDMSDSAAEATMRQIEDLRGKLQEQTQEQRELNAKVGGRMTRSMLRGLLMDTEAEANDLKEQAEEGRRRVAHAAEIATLDEMPRVEAARVRLDRMERHAALLEGRAEQVRSDLAYYCEEARIRLLPEIEDENAKPADLYPQELLETADKLLMGGGDVKKQGQRLFSLWPWKDHTPRAIADAVTRKGGSGDCLGSFWTALMSACGKEAL